MPLAPALLAALVAAAPAAEARREALEPLMDNSFLLEEAYNQEAGVVQNIFTYQRDRVSGSWVATYTNEWPVTGPAHQLSYTLTWARDGAPGGAGGLSDVYLNYRWQALGEGRLVVAPRLSAIVPAGGPDTGVGYRGLGLQTNLPVSLELTPWLVSHTNLGLTWVPHGEAAGARTGFFGLSGGQSLVWLLHPRFNLLAELVWSSTDAVAGGVTSRSQQLTVSPGARWGIDLPGDVQVVLGAAAPLGVGPSAGDRAVFAYLSVELPYWHPAEEKDAGKAPAAGEAGAR